MAQTTAEKRHKRNYMATNGLRAPDWRWQLAVDSMPTTDVTRHPDATCWHLAEYLESGDEWISATNERRRFSIRPLLAIRNDRMRRLTLEARILAFRDIEIAAKACRLPTQIAQDYCSVFFDVNDRLHARIAIDLKIIHDTLERDDIVRRELFRNAYFGGPIVAEHWLAELPFIGASAEHDLETKKGRLREQIELTIASREPTSEFYDPRLILAYQRLLDREPKSRTYAEYVENHVTDVMVTHWRKTPTKAAQQIVESRIAA